MTNPDNAGGLPEFVAVGEFVGYGRVTGEPHVRMSPGLRPGVRLFTEDQMREAIELCRAAPAGYRPYGGDPAEPRDDSDRYDSAPTGGDPICPECKALVLFECAACSHSNYPPFIALARIDGEVDLSAAAGRACDFSWDCQVVPVSVVHSLLRKLQQGADGARMFTRDDLPEASHSTTVGNGTYLHCYLGREVIDIVNNHIAASQGQEGGTNG